MHRLAIRTAIAAGLVAVLVVAWSGSHAQEEEPEQRTQIVAAVDITPVQKELAALRAELVAIRQAIADTTGVRSNVEEATAAVKAMGEKVAELTEAFKKHAETAEPLLANLKPETRWEYKILRSRSEEVANRWGREGWFLVTAGTDWLYFRRPLPAAGND